MSSVFYFKLHDKVNCFLNNDSKPLGKEIIDLRKNWALINISNKMKRTMNCLFEWTLLFDKR